MMGIENTVGGKALGMDRPLEGDDAPAPTAQWTVDEDGTLRFGDKRMAHNLIRCGLSPTHPDTGVNYLTAEAFDALVALVRRAGAAPDLTALPTTEQVLAWLVRHERWFEDETDIDYVADVLAAVAALVRDTPDEAAPDLTALRDVLAESMCRHTFIADWYEKADLVLADLVAALGRDTPDGDDGD